MAIRTEFIALVIVRRKGGVNDMEKENYDSLVSYKLAMSMARTMLSQGLISEEEYIKIETKMCEKYCINLSCFFRDKGSK